MDTAPWYGHGTSEVVIGWALEEILRPNVVDRKDILINTKVGRYEAEPSKQFDFSKQTTLHSVKRSLTRMKCQYIDVLQLHDPEFAPSLEQLMDETIPAMLECQANGWCRELGMTGYPLQVQHQILEKSLEAFGKNIWSQSLTYCLYNLFDKSLFDPLPGTGSSFAVYCLEQHSMGLLAAAPLAMGLLSHRDLADWHPAGDRLKEACREAARICQAQGVDLSKLAMIFALANPRISCTILGMKDVHEVKIVQDVAFRLLDLDESLSSEEVLHHALQPNERATLKVLLDRRTGPFASIWKEGDFQWDGVAEVDKFWKQVPSVERVKWQAKSQ